MRDHLASMPWSLKFSVLYISLVLLLLQTPAALAIKKSYIVYLGGHSHDEELNLAALDQRVVDSHHELLSSILGSKDEAKDAIFYSYKRHINGFAAMLDEEQATEIAKHPSVVSVFSDKARKLQTTRSWNFLSLERNGVVHKSSLWKKARYGEDTIIGNLDTGVWPESKSFSDKGYPPVPPKWKGKCNYGNTTATGVRCNRKLVGARYFNQAYQKNAGKVDPSTNSPRDYEGHGTHTLSTAAGNFVGGANVFGFGNGTAKGGSPKARVSAYKVCWPGIQGGCFDGDIMKGFDMAIHDGVDVLSVSLGGEATPFVDYLEDGIAIGAFHAVKNGIVVVCSAGNSGPSESTVSNVAPWMITVGASTIDREFQAYVQLGNGKRLKGTSISKPLPDHKLYPLVNAADAKAANSSADQAMLCKEGTLDPEKVKGKILVCLRGGSGRVSKGVQAHLAGAAGMILCNDNASGNGIIADPHLLPASNINYTDGLALYAYLNSTKDPKGYIEPPYTQLDTKPAPVMASFSSNGPNLATPEILKPDITAPGVSIIAAYSEAVSPSSEPEDKRISAYNTESGTSMSCPHVAGVVGLLKTLYPDWSAAAIKSAIMTTARTRDNTVNPMHDSLNMKATPFNYGAGHIRPNRAMNPGLVYDLTVNDYLNFLCGVGYPSDMIAKFSGVAGYKCPKDGFNLLNFNYPSITVPDLPVGKVITVGRTLKNVGSPEGTTYFAHVRSPRGVSVSVEPSSLTFDKIGQEKSFKLTLQLQDTKELTGYVFGELLWSDGKHHVRSPIVVNST